MPIPRRSILFFAWSSSEAAADMLREICRSHRGSTSRLAELLFNNETKLSFCTSKLRKAYDLCRRHWNKVISTVRTEATITALIPACPDDPLANAHVLDSMDHCAPNIEEQGEDQEYSSHSHQRRKRGRPPKRDDNRPVEPFPDCGPLTTEIPYLSLLHFQANQHQRDSFIREIALKLNIAEDCTANVAQQYELRDGKGNVRGFKLRLECAAENCFYYVIEFLQPKDVNQKRFGFAVFQVRPARRHLQCHPRQIRGTSRVRLSEQAAVCGGSTLLSHQETSRCFRGETHRMCVPTPRTIRDATYQQRFPQDILKIDRDDIEALKLYHESKNIHFIADWSVLPFRVTFGLPSLLELFPLGSNLIMYLDGTGTVVTKGSGDPSSRRVFLYSSVFKSEHLPEISLMGMPVWEALTNSHSTESIDNYLGNLRTQLTTGGGKHKPRFHYLPKHVVIDYCWAFIHSALKNMARHPTNIIDYLNQKFAVAKEKDNPQSKLTSADEGFKLSICKSHMVHAWTTHSSLTKKSNRNQYNQKQVIIRGCLQMAHATTFSQATLLFRDLCILCTAEDLTEEVKLIAQSFCKAGELFDQSTKEILSETEGGKIKESEMAREDPEKELDNENAENLEKTETVDRERPSPSTIRQNSKFFQHFESTYQMVREELENFHQYRGDLTSEDDFEPNPYQNEEFLQYLRNHWTMIFPMWSRLCVGAACAGGLIQLLTNGLVERYFLWVKSTRLFERHTLSPVRFLYRHADLLTKHAETAKKYLDDLKKARGKRKQKKPGRKRGRSYNCPIDDPTADFFRDQNASEDEIPEDVGAESTWKSSRVDPAQFERLQVGATVSRDTGVSIEEEPAQKEERQILKRVLGTPTPYLRRGRGKRISHQSKKQRKRQVSSAQPKNRKSSTGASGSNRTRKNGDKETFFAEEYGVDLEASSYVECWRPATFDTVNYNILGYSHPGTNARPHYTRQEAGRIMDRIMFMANTYGSFSDALQFVEAHYRDTVTVGDLASLLPGHQVCSPVMDAYLMALGQDAPPNIRSAFYLLSFQVMTAICEGTYQMASKSKGNALHPATAAHGKKLIGFFLEDNHWMLMVINMTTRKFALLDPMDRPQVLRLKKLGTNLRKVLGETFHPDDVVLEGQPISGDQSLMAIPRVWQNDGHNCGPFSCEYARCVMSKDPSTLKNVRIGNLAQEIVIRKTIGTSVIFHGDRLCTYCYKCGGTAEYTDWVECSECRRWLHTPQCTGPVEIDNEYRCHMCLQTTFGN